MNLTEEQRAYIFSQVNPATGRNFTKGERLKTADVERILTGFTPAATQAADTAQAQDMLGSMPVATPNAAAATQPQQSTAGYATDFTDFNLRPSAIDAVVQEVDQRAAMEQPAPQATEPAQPTGLDMNRIQGVLTTRQVELNRVAPIEKARYRSKDVEAQLQKETVRLSNNFISSAKDLSAYGIQDENTFNALATEPFEVRAGAAKIVEGQMARGETPGWLTAVAQVKNSSGTGTSADGKPIDPRANTWWEYGEAVAAAEKLPDDPAANALVAQLGQKLAGERDPDEAYKHLQNVNLALADVGRLQASNVYDKTGLVSIFDGAPIEGKDAVDKYKQELTGNRISTTGFMQNRPETWRAVPSPQQFREQGRSISDYANYVKDLPEGSVFVDANTGSLGVKGVIATTTQPPQITEDNPFSSALRAEADLEALTVKRGKQTTLEKSRKELTGLEADAAKLAKNPSAKSNIPADFSTLMAGRMIGGAIPPMPARESSKLKAERYATLKQEIEALERELGIVP